MSSAVTPYVSRSSSHITEILYGVARTVVSVRKRTNGILQAKCETGNYVTRLQTIPTMAHGHSCA